MIWKDIPGYEGLYQVSDCGKVKSCERLVSNKRGFYLKKEKIRKHNIANGYHKVDLYKDGKAEIFLVHRLVMYAFVGINKDMTVNHIDENKSNNHISNLEYLSKGDNTRAWNKNNPERRAEINKKATSIANRLRSWEKATEAISKQVFDTQNNKIFSSITEVSRYMYENECASSPWIWYNKIRQKKQDRFKIL